MDSTINTWSTRRSLKNSKTKQELLLELTDKLSTRIDLSPMTKEDIVKVSRAVGAVKAPMPPCTTKKDYANYLNTVLNNAPSAIRLSKNAIKQLSEEFNEKR